MCHPDPGFAEESWTAKASKQDMLDQFGSWDPLFLRKLVDLIPDENILIWQLCQHEPLPTWVVGKVVLLGDACHPMLPYVAQGAAQAIEDAAVLHLALDRVANAEDLPVLLKAFELARKERAEHIMSVAGNNRIGLHLPDGPEQEERDRQFKLVAQGGDNPDLLGNEKTQQALWAHDPEKDFLEKAECEFEIRTQHAREVR
jgi:salicylate hydroxylase